MGPHNKFPAELRERAARLVSEQDAHASQWAAIVSIVAEDGLLRGGAAGNGAAGRAY